MLIYISTISMGVSSRNGKYRAQDDLKLLEFSSEASEELIGRLSEDFLIITR